MEGREHLVNERHGRQLCSSTTDNNIRLVQKHLKGDRHLMFIEIVNWVMISYVLW